VVGTLTRQLLVVKETLKPPTLTFDIWERFVFALDDVAGGQDQFSIHPLHMLLVKDLQEVRDTHDLLVFGLEDGYCSENESLYECEMESGLPCILVRDVMHGVL